MINGFKNIIYFDKTQPPPSSVLKRKLHSPIWSERLWGSVGLWRTVSLVVTGVREQWYSEGRDWLDCLADLVLPPLSVCGNLFQVAPGTRLEIIHLALSPVQSQQYHKKSPHFDLAF